MTKIWLGGVLLMAVASAQQAPLPIHDLQALPLWSGSPPGSQGAEDGDIPNCRARPRPR